MKGRWLVVAAVAVVACLVAGWFAARAFESPAQRQARARPPAPEPIVAAVTTGTLADEVTARARIAPAVADRLKLAAVPDRGVVTGVPTARGALVSAGASLLTINGRPVFVLPGRFRFYRDISDGMTGPDVAQLQSGLVAAGRLSAGVESGTYGPVTQAAVRAMYQAVGAEPVTQPAATSASDATSKGSAARRAPPPPAPPELPVMVMSEVAVTPRLPATLATSLSVGAEVRPDRPVATLTSGALVAHAEVAASVVGRIRRGMRAELIASRGSRTVAAEVLTVGRAGQSQAGALHDVTLGAVGGAMPTAWKGANVLARIVTTLVQHHALIVPTRAVAQGAEGRSYVLKRVDDGRFIRVGVRPLGSLAGRTAVAPIVPRALARSDRVRVG